jgi:hypothetical protein
MSSDHIEVRETIHELNIKTKAVDDLDCQAVGNAMYGLRRMSSEHAEVRDVLSTFSSKVREMSVKDFTTEQIKVSTFY